MAEVRKFDAVIVGAGPAGTIAARDLARAGARVALVDGSHPREKACGGGVTGRALALVGASAPGGLPIDIVHFEAAGRRATTTLRDDAALRVFAREQFDAALLKQAQHAGAEFLPSRVTAMSRGGNVWQIQTPNRTVEAPWLLGADGAGGMTRKQVFRPFERRQLSIAAGSYVDGVNSREIVIAFVDRPRGYLWSFPRHGHLAVGTCAQADEASTADMHLATDRWLDGYAPASRKTRRKYAWPIPSLSARDLDDERPAGRGWLLLGDAAGLVDPITREGIFFAIRSGMLAAEALLSPDAVSTYAGSVRDELHAEIRRAARLKAGFYRPRFTRLLIDALNSSHAVRDVMTDLVSGRQPYAGLRKRLVQTFEFGLMFRLLATRLGDKAS